MHTLIIIAHPSPESFTHAVAARIAEGITAAGGSNTVETADLVAEGFDPTFSAEDFAGYRNKAPKPADVLAEQQRVDRADALVFVYPVYWWTMPAIMRGWLERIFTVGWAVGYDADWNRTKLMGRLKIHLVAIAGGDENTYAAADYAGANRTITDEGIFGYCGAPVHTSELMLGVDMTDPTPHLATAFGIGEKIGAGG